MVRLVFFNDTATTEIYTLSLHDALPIYELDPVLADHLRVPRGQGRVGEHLPDLRAALLDALRSKLDLVINLRSEEHTSELQSRQYLVCRLLLENKNTISRCAFVHNAAIT